MSRYQSYLSTAKAILQQFNGEIPLSVFIKKFFSDKKKFGSRDRRIITQLCHGYFRMGKRAENNFEQSMLLEGLFLSTRASSLLLNEIAPYLNDKIECPLHEKLVLLGLDYKEMTKWFPVQYLSAQVEALSYMQSFFVQPAVFGRIRPSATESVNARLPLLPAAEMKKDRAIMVEPGTDLSAYFELDREVVIQDWQSQHVLDYVADHENKLFGHVSARLNVWDCCAASGGKSILLKDKLKKEIALTVSDKRKSILSNLKERFERANMGNHRSIVCDLTEKINQNLFDESFDLILCDVPCTGSGTWSRTPEQVYFQEPTSVESYAVLQRKIVANALPFLHQEGILVYITCSVFHAENEDNIALLTKEHSLTLLHQVYLKGYEERSDSMFVAVLKNKSSVL